MDQNQKTLTVSPADWGDALAEILAPAFTSENDLVGVGRQVVDGAAVAFAVEDRGDLIAAFILRVDGDEGVVVAASGIAGDTQLILSLLPSIESRFFGCRSIRFHTSRPGLARLMKNFGYVGQEVVLRKEFIDRKGGVH